MRKIYTNTMMVLMLALTMLTFTSCDKDTMLAIDLDGIWAGTVVGDYYYDRYGLAGDVYDTELCFYQSGDFSKGVSSGGLVIRESIFIMMTIMRSSSGTMRSMRWAGHYASVAISMMPMMVLSLPPSI